MKLPSLASLRAFEAAARHLGFSAAGRELNVSHAAVAQQVRGLEAFLGLKLVARAGRGLELTPEGVLLADHLAEGFGKISSGIQQLTEAESARPLHITMTPSFAIGWLMPRLPLFREAHPEVELMVNPTVNVVSLADAGYDLAIRFGRGPWPGLESVPLISTNFTIVAAPKLLEGRDISSPGDLLDLPWLQEYGTQEVVDWLATRGVVLPKMARVTDLPGYMLLPALRDGQGVGAAARMFLDGDIEDGRLVALFEESDEKSPTAYHLVWRPGIQRPALKAFIRWIRRAA